MLGIRYLIVIMLLVGCSREATTNDSAATSVVPTPSASVSSPAEVPGCVPDCHYGLTVPGDLAGGYQTEWFFGGELRAKFDGGWTSTEDSSGEFNAFPGNDPDASDYGVFFWLDVYPVESFDRVEDVPLTTEGWLDWMRSNPNLQVSEAAEGSIGHLPATVVEVRLSPSAENDELGNSFCEKNTCLNFLGFDQWEDLGTWGIAGKQVQRLYLSDVTYGGEQHVFVVALAPNTPPQPDPFVAATEDLLNTVEVPVDPA